MIKHTSRPCDQLHQSITSSCSLSTNSYCKYLILRFEKLKSIFEIVCCLVQSWLSFLFFVVFDNMRFIPVMYTCNFPINTGSLKSIIKQFATDLHQSALFLFEKRLMRPYEKLPTSSPRRVLLLAGICRTKSQSPLFPGGGVHGYK